MRLDRLLPDREVLGDFLVGAAAGEGREDVDLAGRELINRVPIAPTAHFVQHGLRRALGATRKQIAAQFLAESLLLSTIGGIMGVAAGILATAGYTTLQGWMIRIPLTGWAALIAAIGIGAVAGLYPALRAARLAPTDALRST